jgi:hypothetical protein
LQTQSQRFAQETSMSDKKPAVPDPATSYERAKPAEQSPGGKMDQPKPPAPQEKDHLQQHNSAPDTKHKQQK